MEDAAFKERTEWRKKWPALPRWPSRRKANKRKPRGSASCVAEGEAGPKRKCSTRSKVKGVFTSGASAALIKKGFPDHSGVVISEKAPIPEDLLNVSLEEVIFSPEWVPEVILPDPFPAFDSFQDDIQEITPEKVLDQRRRSCGLRRRCWNQRRRRRLGPGQRSWRREGLSAPDPQPRVDLGKEMRPRSTEFGLKI